MQKNMIKYRKQVIIMKVLLINHFPLEGSGSGVYTKTLATNLIKRNHQVAIIYPENTIESTYNDNIIHYPVIFNSEDIPFNFPCFTTHPRSSFNFKNMTEDEKNLYEKVFFNKILEVIEDFEPDIIHANHIWTLSGISAEIAKIYNIPLILTCHGTDLIGINDEYNDKVINPRGRNWADKAVEYADTIITISNDNKTMATNLFNDNIGKFVLINNAINSDIFKYDPSISKSKILEELNLPIKNNLVSFAGKLTYIKGVDTLLKASQLYQNEDTITIISGDGEERQKLENYVKDNSIENVFFIGNQPQNKLSKIYNISNCLVVPSRKEAFGLVAVEAMACGIPVIATNQGGLKELIDKDVGLVFEVDDYKTLANDIEKILNKDITFDKEKIINKSNKYYSEDNLTNKVEKIYNKALHKINVAKNNIR